MLYCSQLKRVFPRLTLRDGTPLDWPSGGRSRVSAGIWDYTDRHSSRDDPGVVSTSVPEIPICYTYRQPDCAADHRSYVPLRFILVKSVIITLLVRENTYKLCVVEFKFY